MTVKMNSKTDPLLKGRNVPISSNPYFTFKYFKFNSNRIKSQTRVSWATKAGYIVKMGQDLNG